MPTQYKVPELQEFHWQQPVVNLTTNTPPSVSKGARYVVGSSPTGDWVGHSKEVATYNGSSWDFDAPVEGWAVWDKNTDYLYVYSGTTWQATGIYSSKVQSCNLLLNGGFEYCYAGVDIYTKLLIHADGADTSTNFIDIVGHTITAQGNAQLDTAQKKFGDASLLLDGTGDYLTLADSDDWYFGSADFTVDFWVRFNVKQYSTFVHQRNGSDTTYFQFTIDSSGKLAMLFLNSNVTKGNYITTSAPTLNTGVWYHIAFVRYGSTGLIFVDGVSQTLTENTAFSTNDVGNAGGTLNIGTNLQTELLNGWMDEIRISKGIARWTSSFTPPSSAYLNNNSLPEAWTGVTASGGTILIDSDIVKTGYKYSARLISDADGSVLYQTFSSGREVNFKGKTVTFSAWVYSANASTARLRITDDISTSEYSSYHTGDSTWQLLTVTVTLQSSLGSASFFICNDGNIKEIYVCGAMVVEGIIAFAYTPNVEDYLYKQSQFQISSNSVQTATENANYNGLYDFGATGARLAVINQYMTLPFEIPPQINGHPVVLDEINIVYFTNSVNVYMDAIGVYVSDLLASFSLIVYHTEDIGKLAAARGYHNILDGAVEMPSLSTAGVVWIKVAGMAASVSEYYCYGFLVKYHIKVHG